MSVAIRIDGRGTEDNLVAYRLLDIIPKGRDESPGGNLTGSVKRHDEYGGAKSGGCCGG